MEPSTVALIVALSALVLSIAALVLAGKNPIIAPAAPSSPVNNDNSDYTSRPLQLQAYERLVVLTERIALPNLVGRVNQAGVTAGEMRALLIENIKQEYEYNSSQQIYVSQQAWEAVRNFKDQSMLMVNRVAASMSHEASGTDLNKKILETMLSQKLGEVHNLVLEALNFEAKKLMR